MAEILRSRMDTLYQSVPELSEEDLKNFRGFRPGGDKDWRIYERYRDVFLEAVAESVKNPGWLANPGWNSYQTSTPQFGKPGPRRTITNELAVVREDYPNLLDFANKFNEHQIPYLRDVSHDITARALELMDKRIPNFSLFRGTAIDILRGFAGIDFAPGILPISIEYLERFGKYKVLAMIKAKDVANFVSLRQVEVATENNWWRNSLELHFYTEEARKFVTLRRFPENEERASELLRMYSEYGYKV